MRFRYLFIVIGFAFAIALAGVESAPAQVVVVNVGRGSYPPPAYANYGPYRPGCGNYYRRPGYAGAFYPQRDYRYQWQTPYYGFRANRVYFGYGYGY